MKTLYLKAIEKEAKLELKSNLCLIGTLKDIQHHFRTQKKPWPLSFAVYKGLTQVKNIDVFVAVLRLKKFKVKYNESRGLVITK